MKKLLHPRDIDRHFGWPRGRATKLARANRIPHVVIPPNGDILFDEDALANWLDTLASASVQCLEVTSVN